ncbi:MAG: hypothetical protein JWR10_2440 [Rubritepida sp.]|nr:hypothetical protein [Rubritepida sp.]
MADKVPRTELTRAIGESSKPFEETARKGEEIAANIVRDGLKTIVLLNSGAALAMPAVTTFIGFDAAAKASLIYPMGLFAVGVISGVFAMATAYFAMCMHIEGSRADGELRQHQHLHFLTDTMEASGVKELEAKKTEKRDDWWRRYKRWRLAGMVLFALALAVFVAGAIWVFWLALMK